MTCPSMASLDNELPGAMYEEYFGLSIDLFTLLNLCHHVYSRRDSCSILSSRSMSSDDYDNLHAVLGNFLVFLSDVKNQTIVSSCVTHILPSCGYFKGQEQICFNPTSWHLVTYNFLRGHKF